MTSRLLKNAHLPFDRPFDTLRVPSNVEGLMALSKVEGRRYPHSPSLRRTSLYASLLGISDALHLSVSDQPAKQVFCSNLLGTRREREFPRWRI
jgi:hypothetical protein